MRNVPAGQSFRRRSVLDVVMSILFSFRDRSNKILHGYDIIAAASQVGR